MFAQSGTGFIFLLVVVCRCDEVLTTHTFLFEFDDGSTFTRLADASELYQGQPRLNPVHSIVQCGDCGIGSKS
jgi:hypothetical protein